MIASADLTKFSDPTILVGMLSALQEDPNPYFIERATRAIEVANIGNSYIERFHRECDRQDLGKIVARTRVILRNDSLDAHEKLSAMLRLLIKKLEQFKPAGRLGSQIEQKKSHIISKLEDHGTIYL